MDFYERAKRVVASVIASVLNTTIAIVGRMLPYRADWLERIAFLAAEFASVDAAAREPAGPEPEPGSAGSAETAGAGLEPLHAAYQELWQFIQKIRVEGLLFDEEFCAHVEKEWSTATLLAYIKAADVSLKERAEEAQSLAGHHMTSGNAN